MVATGVVIQAILFLALANGWILVPLVYGFAARVLTGPSASPLGQFATRVAVPRMRGPHREVPGTPKRFAQTIGLAFSASASILWLSGYSLAAQAVIGGLVAAASLEAFFGICIGCIVYNRIWGCEECGDISKRWNATSA